MIVTRAEVLAELLAVINAIDGEQLVSLETPHGLLRFVIPATSHDGEPTLERTASATTASTTRSRPARARAASHADAPRRHG